MCRVCTVSSSSLYISIYSLHLTTGRPMELLYLLVEFIVQSTMWYRGPNHKSTANGRKSAICASGEAREFMSLWCIRHGSSESTEHKINLKSTASRPPTTRSHSAFTETANSSKSNLEPLKNIHNVNTKRNGCQKIRRKGQSDWNDIAMEIVRSCIARCWYTIVTKRQHIES